MAYFGDTLAHAALLGVALGYLLDIELAIGVVATSMALALLLVVVERRRLVPTDTLLGILAHSGLAIGLVVIAFVETLRVDLMAYLFGDLLAVTSGDLWWIAGAAAIALPLVAWAWRPLVATTVSEDMAAVEGVPIVVVRLLFPALLALVVAVAMKVVGVLLVTALLILPAAAAPAVAHARGHGARRRPDRVGLGRRRPRHVARVGHARRPLGGRRRPCYLPRHDQPAAAARRSPRALTI